MATTEVAAGVGFQRYQHVERFGTAEVEGIEFGTCHVFPKIDGTNVSAWIDGATIRLGSRNREITADYDHFGLYSVLSECPRLAGFFSLHPDLRLYGEWLVPHSLKTYREDAWKKFYVFDAARLANGEVEYLPYDEYQPMLEACGIEYIPCLAVIKNGTYEMFLKQLEANHYLIQDGRGLGEGLVIKNYGYTNRFGRTTWAKIVTSVFAEKNLKAMGAPAKSVRLAAEEHFTSGFCTEEMIRKTKAKIEAECGGWSSLHIPRLLGTVYHDLVVEECWNFLKKHKNPIVNFARLHGLVVAKIKDTLPEVF